MFFWQVSRISNSPWLTQNEQADLWSPSGFILRLRNSDQSHWETFDPLVMQDQILLHGKDITKGDETSPCFITQLGDSFLWSDTNVGIQEERPECLEERLQTQDIQMTAGRRGQCWYNWSRQRMFTLWHILRNIQENLLCQSEFMVQWKCRPPMGK